MNIWTDRPTDGRRSHGPTRIPHFFGWYTGTTSKARQRFPFIRLTICQTTVFRLSSVEGEKPSSPFPFTVIRYFFQVWVKYSKFGGAALLAGQFVKRAVGAVTSLDRPVSANRYAEEKSAKFVRMICTDLHFKRPTSNFSGSDSKALYMNGSTRLLEG